MPEWPYPQKKVIVLSKTLQSIKKEAELFQGDPDTLLSRLHLEGIRHVWIDGGITISQFLQSQLVDHLTISVIPVILGSGIPLFNKIGKEISCTLLTSQSYPSGLVQLSYKIVK